MRVSRSSIARHKKLLEHAKGYWGRNKNCFRIAKRVVEKGWQYAYRDRRNKKRDIRALWIQRINAAARLYGTTYSRLIHAMQSNNVHVDRKILADMTINNQQNFETLVKNMMGN